MSSNRFLMLAAILALSACSTTSELDSLLRFSSTENSEIILPTVPFYAQQDFQCGPAALAMVLTWSGVDTTPEQLVPQVYLPKRQGSLQAELISASRRYARIPYVIDASLKALIVELEAGHPVIVLQNLGLSWYPKWHYAVVVGVNLQTRTITLHSGTTERYVMNLGTFERTWLRSEKWALVILPPERLPATALPENYLSSIAYFDNNNKLNIAETAYQSALKRWSENIVTNMALANLYYRRDKLDAAKMIYQSVITRHPGYSPAHNNLAQVYLQLGDNESALSHAQMAVSQGGAFATTYQQTLQEIRMKSSTGR